MNYFLAFILSAVLNLSTIGAEQGYFAFYKIGPTEFLGNFANVKNGMEYQGRHFQNSEAAFQWTKYHLAALEHHREDMLRDPEMDQFFEASGGKAFRLKQKMDQKYKGIYPKEWMKGLRDQVMWEILQAKFGQNPEFAQNLQATAPYYLLEHNEKEGRDTYWSDDHTGNGFNMLGKMLMALRDGLPCPQPYDDSDRPERIRYANHFNQNKPYIIW